MPNKRPHPRAFTLFEILVVVFVLAIVAAICVPVASSNISGSRLSTAANVLAADIEFCSSECITHPSDARGITFDTVNNKYTLIDLSSTNAINHPADSLPYINDFATGRNAQLIGVTITSVTSNGSAVTLLSFNQYGTPLNTSTLSIVLSYNGATMTVSVAPTTGDVSIQ